MVIQGNCWPEQRFETDESEDRVYFLVRLPLRSASTSKTSSRAGSWWSRQLFPFWKQLRPTVKPTAAPTTTSMPLSRWVTGSIPSRLFYSYPDQQCFVAVQDTRNKTVVTILRSVLIFTSRWTTSFLSRFWMKLAARYRMTMNQILKKFKSLMFWIKNHKDHQI